MKSDSLEPCAARKSDGTELNASRGYRDRVQALLGKKPSPGS